MSHLLPVGRRLKLLDDDSAEHLYAPAAEPLEEELPKPLQLTC